MKHTGNHVYVVGAGFSAGLGFPTVKNLLERVWPRIRDSGLEDDLAQVIRFHHPNFNASLPCTFPDVETLLSEMQANEQLFESSRQATGKFTASQLEERRRTLLLQIAQEFHVLQAKALANTPAWLTTLIDRLRAEQAQIISFNWDLVIDELLFGQHLSKSDYGFGRRNAGPRLIKPHGSLNWYTQPTGRHLKKEKKFKLFGQDGAKVYSFKPYRAPKSLRRDYMPLIIPPLFHKSFDEEVFRPLWQEAVSILSTAAKVTFLGYSLANADFHARFILRCGFHNQEEGSIDARGSRRSPTGRAAVEVVDPDRSVKLRIESAVGWSCQFHNVSLEEWVTSAAT